jgi:Skp family chaperone for outer membrane proteins
VKQILFRPAFAAALIVVASGYQTAHAQNNVAVVDVALVFKNHAQFNAQMAALKEEANALNQQLQSRAQQLAQWGEELKSKQPGSAEFQALETQLAQASANLEVDRRTKLRDLISREAKLHFDTYVEVTRQIAQVCEQQNLRLVLRYDSTPMTPDNPQSIMQRVNSEIVYCAPHRDITQQIIGRLNPAAQGAQASVPGEVESLRR